MTPAALKALVAGDLENFVAASTPGGIEAQEARGQQTLCQSSQLPIEMLHGCTKEGLESLGVAFKNVADDLFWNVTLPTGWNLQPSDHSMWNSLVDDKGRTRARIFYKAAFYDRKAHISLSSRYQMDSYHDISKGVYAVVILDGEKVLYEAGQYEDRDYTEQDRLRVIATEWMKQNYPDYENPLAYWD